MALSVQDNQLPRYLQVHGLLKEWILKGRYAPNEKLPTEGELCKLFGVSRITTRRAIEMLSNDGLIRRVQGLGIFVASSIPELAEPLRNMADLAKRVERLSHRTRLADLELETVRPDSAIARELKLGEDEEVHRISYTRLERNTPIGCAEAFVPVRLGVPLTKQAIIRNPSPSLLQGLGLKVASAHQLVGATLSDSQHARRLNIPVGAPLVRIRLLILDAEEQPIEYLIAHYRADLYEHHALLSSF